MHHARAMELEARGDHDRANADWEAALAHWHRLWKCDEFWNQLAELACKNAKRDAVDALREEFPVLFSQIHYDIAFQPGTKNHRVRYHIDFVLTAPFPQEAIDAVRRNSYARAIGNVPPAVWQINELNPETIMQGTDAIKKYLELDPGCVPALEDALRLQVRLLRARYTDLQALGQGESPERTRLLGTLKRDAEEWRKYLDQLVPLAQKLEESVRQKLCLWYRVMGEIYCALKQWSDALPFYEQGVKAGATEDDDHKRCVASLGETHAFLARKQAGEKKPTARAYCDQVANRTDLSLAALFLLANAYSLLSEFDLARKICTRGLQLQPDEAETDPDAIAAFGHGQEQLRQMLLSIDQASKRHDSGVLLNRAVGHIKASRYSEAIPLVTQALEILPENAWAYYLRCKCHLATEKIWEARADLDTFNHFMDDSEEDKAAATELEAEVAKKEKDLADFGDAALGLKGQAREAFERGDTDAGIALVRQAAAACKSPQWRSELSQFLNGLAVEILNAKAEDEKRFGTAAHDIMQQVEKLVGPSQGTRR
jgi:tetratricopeptide (TPR) repeat protein